MRYKRVVNGGCVIVGYGYLIVCCGLVIGLNGVSWGKVNIIYLFVFYGVNRIYLLLIDTNASIQKYRYKFIDMKLSITQY